MHLHSVPFMWDKRRPGKDRSSRITGCCSNSRAVSRMRAMR
jgi:hypothetical protein